MTIHDQVERLAKSGSVGELNTESRVSLRIGLGVWFCFLATATELNAGILYIRRMPPPGATTTWEIVGPSGKRTEPPQMTSTTGPRETRQKNEYQQLEVSGWWLDGDKKIRVRACYEVDLGVLAKTGDAGRAARVVRAWQDKSGKMEEITAKDPMWRFYSALLISTEKLEADSNSGEGAAADAKSNGVKLTKLVGRARTSEFGSGNVPTSRFEAWTSEDGAVPFGVDHWRLSFRVGLGSERQTIEVRGRMISHATTQPSSCESAGEKVAP